MSDDRPDDDVSRRDVLRKTAAGGVALGGAVTVGTAAVGAEDDNGTPYCHEQNRCDPTFEPGTEVRVSGPEGGRIGTWENCCILDTGCNWIDALLGNCPDEDRCPEAGYRPNQEATGVVQGTCSYGPLHSPNVLVKWDSDGEETHISESALEAI